MCNMLFEWRHVPLGAQPVRTSWPLLKNPDGDEQPIVTAFTESIRKIKLVFNSLETWPTQVRVRSYPGETKKEIDQGNCTRPFESAQMRYVEGLNTAAGEQRRLDDCNRMASMRAMRAGSSMRAIPQRAQRSTFNQRVGLVSFFP